MTRRVRRRLCKDGGKGKDVAADEERELVSCSSSSRRRGFGVAVAARGWRWRERELRGGLEDAAG